MKKTLARILSMTGAVFMILLILICIPFTLPKLFGMQLYEVKTESMEPEYPVGSVVYVKQTDPEDVVVGDVIHPMAEEHYIEWISLQTKQGNQRKLLLPGMEPKATFLIETDDEVEAVYAYCNLHSLWKA